VKIFLVGDSTVCDYAFDSEYRVKCAGWGRYLQLFFDAPKAAVFNYALSGRSSKSFTVEAEYANREIILNRVYHKDGSYRNVEVFKLNAEVFYLTV
jgi:hypothetical protein